ncbi:MAG: two-component system, NarL family, sensor kinase [Actinomycetota bacterium]|jgi:signal transduction histidine kinase|nr:two-component system, NarL family, sensor kinase [Actinomycetota bacterium]
MQRAQEVDTPVVALRKAAPVAGVRDAAAMAALALDGTLGRGRADMEATAGLATTVRAMLSAGVVPAELLDLDALNGTWAAAMGLRVVAARIIDRMSKHANEPMDEQERTVWRSWSRRRTSPPPISVDDLSFVPIWANDRAVGWLQVRSEGGGLGSEQREAVELLAAAIGSRCERAHDRRQRAVAEERADVAHDAYSKIDHLLQVIGSGVASLSDPSRAADRNGLERDLVRLIRLGRESLGFSARLLSALEYHPDGLGMTVAGVVAKLARSLDVAADVAVVGQSRPLPVAVEQALLRVVYEVLSSVEARGRASAIAVRLEYLPEETRLVVRDDGIGLAARDGGNPTAAIHTGLRTVGQRVAALGGSFELRRSEPRGLELTAAIPLDPR